MPPVAWAAKPWLVAGEVHNLIGQGGVGKSILALDMALGLAAGATILGGTVPVQRAGTVVYFDRDSGAGQTLRRLVALMRGRWGEKPPDSVFTNLYVHCDHTVALEGPGLRNLSAIVEELQPAAIFFDALRGFHTKDENTSRDMAYIYREVLRAIADAGAAVVVLHHEGKPSEYRTTASTASRGSTEITDAADTNLRVSRDPRTNLPTLEMAKARNISGPDWPRPLTYRLEQTENLMRLSCG